MSIKKLFTLSLAVLMTLALVGCSAKPSETPADDKVAVTVTVWGPQEDQSDDNGKWLQTMCENFAAAHPEWEITFNYGVCSEGDAKTNVTTDPAAAADVYMFANDQIPDLLKAGAIAELGGSTVEAIKKNNSGTTVNTVTYDGSVYGVPFTANTWFMYYDKSVFTEEDVKSLDTMLEKGKVAFPLNNSWYLASFYVANGCTLFGPDGGDAAAGFDFSGDKAVAVTDFLVDLVANPNFVNGDVSTGTDISAFFSGTWDAQKALDAYGDNLGICASPAYALGQLKAFAGSKAIGVNPQTALYAEHPEIAVALAAYLGSTEAQQAHYEYRKGEVIPTDSNINVGDDALAKAQMDTMEYASIVQPLQADMGNYWGPAQSMGDELVAGTVTHENAAEKTEAMNAALNSSVVQ
ncbi:MAG: extracellular solute-binding protein [Erysipelotrichaceae bacterium]|nr:extracellular solute-binding protein [Erysipelotrichaceae bacterium]